ncbi:MAG: hypothetical protein WBH35_09925 [Bacillota bacterium]|nr:hypothetical protein [Bacillota bacterium]HOB92117.1 hypothetical protein [Bacillota bacterium]HPZ55173.1 hypothetical protein [Bacillota bacterium]
MKIDWNYWNSGGKIIFASACAAVISMFMDWVDIGIASQSGLTQQAFLLLVLWIYPVLMLLQNRQIRRGWGLACAIASVVFTFAYIADKSVELFGETVNMAASGAYLFLIASIGLVVGVLKYVPAQPQDSEGEYQTPIDIQ